MKTKFSCPVSVLFLPLLLWMVPVASGQSNTTLNLGTQSRNPDFSAMPVTKPVSIGSTLPAACVVGQLFFNTSAATGTNLSSCTANNTWNPVGPSTAAPLAVANGGNGTSTPGLVAGTNVTVSGSWPNQIVASAGSGGTSSGNATAIQGATVSNNAPSNNQTLIYNTSASSYVPTSIFTLQNGLGTSAAGASSLQVNVSMGVRSVTLNSDNLTNSDCGGLVTYTSASAVSVAVAQPALAGNFLAGCPITIRNYGAGIVTATPSSSTIGGAASQAISQNKGCLIISDGTNWQLGNCN